jgi:hypothetical protein
MKPVWVLSKNETKEMVLKRFRDFYLADKILGLLGK